MPHIFGGKLRGSCHLGIRLCNVPVCFVHVVLLANRTYAYHKNLSHIDTDETRTCINRFCYNLSCKNQNKESFGCFWTAMFENRMNLDLACPASCTGNYVQDDNVYFLEHKHNFLMCYVCTNT